MLKKIFLISILLAVLTGVFYSLDVLALAARELEIEYPKLPGVETPTTIKTALPEYIRYFFTFSIMVAGILVFGVMVMGGIRYLTSAGAPTAMSDARDQITSGLLGAIIILASFLILNTINPQLVVPKKPPITAAITGVRLYSNSNDCGQHPIDDTKPIETLNVSQNITDLNTSGWGTGTATLIQSINFLASSDDFTVRIYDQAATKANGGYNYADTGTPQCYGKEAGCTNFNKGDCAPFSDGQRAIRFDWHIPGVYLFPQDGCQGNPKIYQASSAALSGFDNQTRSIKIIYGDCEAGGINCKDQYAAVLHEHESMMGSCQIYVQENGVCVNLSANSLPSGAVSSSTVYLKPKELPTTGGVRFWEHKNYDGDASPTPPGYWTAGSDIGDFGGFNNKATSMEIDGPYVAVLFDNQDYEGKCQVFMSSDPNFRDDPIGQCKFLGRSDCLESFKIRARRY